MIHATSKLKTQIFFRTGVPSYSLGNGIAIFRKNV